MSEKDVKVIKQMKLNHRKYDTLVELTKEVYNYIRDKVPPMSRPDIDWDEVLEIMRQFSSEKGGFNIFPDGIGSLEDFLDLRDNILDAYLNNKPLLRRKCRECGREFFIYKSEMESYNEKGLMLPKRCKSCRLSRRSTEDKMVC